MKICVLGDVHGLRTWREIIAAERENVDRFIFLGDYVDDKTQGSTPQQQADNLRDLLTLDHTQNLCASRRQAYGFCVIFAV